MTTEQNALHSETPDAQLDPPSPDINAVGARERAFPIKIILIVCVVLLALIAALLFWAKTAQPLTAKAGKQELPSSPPPPSSIKPPVITELPAPDDNLRSNSKIPPIAATDLPGANKPCASVALIDKASGKPSLDPATGLPVMIDCNGKTSVASSYGLSAGGFTAPPDRYSGDVLLARQPGNQSDTGTSIGGFSAGQTAFSAANTNTPARSSNPQIPGLPPPPPGLALLAPMLEKLTSQMNSGGSSAPNLIGNGLPIMSPSGANNNLGTGQNPNQNASGSSASKVLAAKTIDENLTVPKGTQIDCVLTTRVVTEISGFATCVVTAHVYSANGRTLLIEKMSEVTGEYAVSTIQAGQRNVQVLWTRLRKPGGVTIELASPSTDGMGAAGLTGEVDNRWTERIGGALLLSVVKDVITYKTAVDSPAGASVLNNTTQQTSSIAEKVLASTIGIKPVLYAHQGARIAIYVARDLDFSNVYVVKDVARAN